MNLKTDYYLHANEKTWLKAKTTDYFATSPSGESLFYLQELPTGEGRICFNSSLASKIGLHFNSLQEDMIKAEKENQSRFTSNKFKTQPSSFKDNKNNSMIFDDAIKQILSHRFWTYSSDLQNEKVVGISAAPFINKDHSKALFTLIKNNFVNIVNEFENAFKDNHNKLSKLNIDIYPKQSSETLKNRIQQIKSQTNNNIDLDNNHYKHKM